MGDEYELLRSVIPLDPAVECSYEQVSLLALEAMERLGDVDEDTLDIQFESDYEVDLGEGHKITIPLAAVAVAYAIPKKEHPNG